eukprot:s60_g5.t1
MPADQVTEKVVTGKVMELKGIQLQKGMTETCCINMTFPEYMKRMGYSMDSKDAPENAKTETDVKGKGKSGSKTKAQTELLLEAASKYLKENGLDNLDPEKFQRAILEYVQGKTLDQLKEKFKDPKIKKEQSSPKMPTVPNAMMTEVYEITSGDEWPEEEMTNPGERSRGSGPH